MSTAPRTERQTWLLDYIEQHGFVTAALAGRLLNIGTRDARQTLRTLVGRSELTVDSSYRPERFHLPKVQIDGQPVHVHKPVGAWSVDHVIGPASIFSMGGAA